ncbi:MAG: hypothetical protein CFK52_12260 [Chloracidobacterium sp. CP2_5A]|nr:MAG: hypothetical protein CFK52_12260 [Chloracidobacterium sp. CP2_5A]
MTLRRALLCILLGLALAGPLPASVFGQAAPAAAPLDLEQPTWLYQWKYRSGDDPAWAAPEFNDADWTPIDLTPGPRFAAGPRLGLGWYRAEVSVANAWRLGIRPSHIVSACAYEAYANGQRIGQYGEIAPRPRFPNGRFQLPIPIPKEALRPDGRLVIAIRALERSELPDSSVAFLGIQIGNLDQLASKTQQQRAEAAQRDVFRLGFVFAFALFALYHLYLHGSLSLGRSKKGQAEYLWLGVLALGYAANSFSISDTAIDVTSQAARLTLNAASVHLQLISSVEFTFRLFRSPVPRWARWHQASQVACIIGTLALPSWLLIWRVNQPLFAASVLSLVLPLTLHIFRLARQGLVEARMLELSAGVIVAAELIQVGRIVFGTLGIGQEHWVRWLFHPLLNYSVDVSFGFFLLLMAGMVARRYRDEIEAVNRNLENAVATRTAEVRRQRDELERKNRDIEDSLRYAQTMQQVILPTLDSLRQTFAEAFILWKPRDIVSGDFYWFYREGGVSLLIVADCTGHGVPGAFMSFIGNDLLNQIVIERGIHDPARILTEIDAGVQRALKQSDQGLASVDDGMDIGVCRLDAAGVAFAGARLSLYVVSDGQVAEYPAARHPIGGRARKARKFESVAVAVAPDAMLYLTTDGFADQPNAAGKRFTTRSLAKALSEVATLPAARQQAALEAILAQHAGDAPQRDDITIIGARLGQPGLRHFNGGASTNHARS